MVRVLTPSEIAAIKTVPPLPAFPLAPEATDNALHSANEFANALRRFEDGMARWRAKLVAGKDQIAGFLAEASASGDARELKVLRDDVLTLMIRETDKAAEQLRSLEPSQSTEEKMALVAKLSPAVGRALGRNARQYREAVARQYDALVELYYQLIALQAEHDPSARAGPSFDDADTLIAALRSPSDA